MSSHECTATGAEVLQRVSDQEVTVKVNLEVFDGSRSPVRAVELGLHVKPGGDMDVTVAKKQNLTEVIVAMTYVQVYKDRLKAIMQERF